MHALHYWAVEAEDREEAFGIVDTQLDDDGSNQVDWSDWHVVGGGRWNPEGDSYTANDSQIISYAETPERFMETIKTIRQWRTDEMNRCLSEIKTDRLVSDMGDYISQLGIPNLEQRFNMNNYYIKNAVKLLTDDYSPDSSFYDLTEHTAHLGYLLERLDNAATSAIQYLVPIDFHF
jgi:hypothetical protein